MAESVLMDHLDRSQVYVVRENTLDMQVHLITFWSEAKNRWVQEYADGIAPEIVAAMSPANRAIVMRAARANLGLECAGKGAHGACAGGNCNDCTSCNCS